MPILDLEENASSEIKPIEWCIIHKSKTYDYIGALIPPFSQLFSTVGGEKNTVFWEKCSTCLHRITNACEGGPLVLANNDCNLDLDYDTYLKSDNFIVKHPLTLTFTQIKTFKRYSFFVSSLSDLTKDDSNLSLIEKFNYLPYVRCNTHASASVCTGSIRTEYLRSEKLSDLFFYEYEKGQGNEDYFKYKKIAGDLDSWVKGFPKYTEILRKEGYKYGPEGYHLYERNLHSMLMNQSSIFSTFNYLQDDIEISSCEKNPVINIDTAEGNAQFVDLNSTGN